jgi:prophage DNA circulation protein
MSVLDRLRPASFVDPEGTEHFFNVDSLERSNSKKGSTQEILDSDESITQDQGNTVWTFPIEAYFTGEDYDGPTDAFVDSLSLRYSQDSPGILKHPRWGNINVFPTSISQKRFFQIQI